MKVYWSCLIGPVERSQLPNGADSAPRIAADRAITQMVGYQPANNWSGWGVTEERKEAILDATCRELARPKQRKAKATAANKRVTARKARPKSAKRTS